MLIVLLTFSPLPFFDFFILHPPFPALHPPVDNVQTIHIYTVANLTMPHPLSQRRSTKQSLPRLVALGAVVPATYVAVLLVVHAFTDGVHWTIHLWAGSVVLVALLGALFAVAAHSRVPATAGWCRG